jgi:HlyD family secretion protein
VNDSLPDAKGHLVNDHSDNHDSRPAPPHPYPSPPEGERGTSVFPSPPQGERGRGEGGEQSPARPLSLSERVRSLRLPQRQAAPPSPRSWFPWVLCGILAASTIYLLVVRPEAKPVKTDDSKDPSASAKTSVEHPETAGEVVMENKGYIMATHLFKVGPNQVGSKIIKLHPRFLEGQRINKGEELARLDDTEYKTKYEQARAEYYQARADADAAEQRWRVLDNGSRPEEIRQGLAELGEARATLDKLRLDLERNTKIKNTGALARRDYEESKFSHDAQVKRVRMLTEKYELVRLGARAEMRKEGKANWELAKAKRDKAKAAMEEAKWRYDNCIIYAPVSGTILKKNVEIGDPLDARAFNLASILCEMADLTDLEVELNIQEREIARLEEGQRCLVRPETHPDKMYEGYVSRKMPTADRSKGAVPVRVKVKNIPRSEEGKYLAPDGGAIVTFLATPKKNDKLTK